MANFLVHNPWLLLQMYVQISCTGEAIGNSARVYYNNNIYSTSANYDNYCFGFKDTLIAHGLYVEPYL